MTIMYESSVMYAKTSTGDIKQWQVRTEDHGNHSRIVMTYGKLGGNLTTRVKDVKFGKNLGKANATIHQEQATLEAVALVQKKVDKDYVENIEEARNSVSQRPMLAQHFMQSGHRIIYPCAVQPKLNGVRCSVSPDSSPRLTSRGGKDYTEVLRDTPLYRALVRHGSHESTLDGEIYRHGWSLQRIISAVKKRSADTLELEFWMYDIQNDKSFLDRWNFLIQYGDYLAQYPQEHHFNVLSTYSCSSEEEVHKYHDQFVSEGYEGIIIRNLSGLYACGQRSADLQKLKNMKQDEYKIIGSSKETQQYIRGTDGESVDIDLIVFTCETPEGRPFNCRPKGTQSERSEMWNNRDSYVGKMLTVDYQELTDDGVPQFPVGVTVRDYE